MGKARRIEVGDVFELGVGKKFAYIQVVGRYRGGA